MYLNLLPLRHYYRWKAIIVIKDMIILSNPLLRLLRLSGNNSLRSKSYISFIKFLNAYPMVSRITSSSNSSFKWSKEHEKQIRHLLNVNESGRVLLLDHYYCCSNTINKNVVQDDNKDGTSGIDEDDHYHNLEKDYNDGGDGDGDNGTENSISSPLYTSRTTTTTTTTALAARVIDAAAEEVVTVAAAAVARAEAARTESIIAAAAAAVIVSLLLSFVCVILLLLLLLFIVSSASTNLILHHSVMNECCSRIVDSTSTCCSFFEIINNDVDDVECFSPSPSHKECGVII